MIVCHLQLTRLVLAGALLFECSPSSYTGRWSNYLYSIIIASSDRLIQTLLGYAWYLKQCFLDFFPPLNLTPYGSVWLSWRKLTPSLNSPLMVTQPHSLLATRTTWTTQVACLASLYSCTVLCTFQWCTYDWSACRTRLKLTEPTSVLFPPSYCTRR